MRVFLAALICLMLTCSVARAEGEEQRSPESEPAQFKGLPLVGWLPSIGPLIGGFGKLGFQWPGESGKRSSVSGLGLYTLEGRLLAKLGYKINLNDALWTIHGDFKGKIWPKKYYGIGARTRDLPDRFEARSFEARTGVRYRLRTAPTLYLEGVHDFEIASFETDEQHRLVDDAPHGQRGGRLSGLGIHLTLDERDSPACPRDGYFSELRLLRFDESLGSQFEFWHAALDGRKYVHLGNQHAIALRSQFIIQSGNVPFYAMPSLGASARSRGIQKNRYTQETLLSGQVEYRTPVFWKFGFTTFAGLGTVGPSVGSLFDGAPKWNAGVGTNLYLDEDHENMIRFDLGFSETGAGVYLSTDAAF